MVDFFWFPLSFGSLDRMKELVCLAFGKIEGVVEKGVCTPLPTAVRSGGHAHDNYIFFRRKLKTVSFGIK